MNYDLALYPASGPGLGHLMRCMALAEWAVELKAKVIVVLGDNAPVLPWPCAAKMGVGADARVKVADGIRMNDGQASGFWQIVDRECSGDTLGWIYPHFGATPIPSKPTFVGPQWMPLRKRFSGQPFNEHTQFKQAYHYRVEKPRDCEVDICGSDVAATLATARYLRCPPSVIAYEALALGTPVFLHDDVPGYGHLSSAMIAAGVVRSGEMDFPHPRRQHIDGFGAKRLLEALL